jgi:hypothetical protein
LSCFSYFCNGKLINYNIFLKKKMKINQINLLNNRYMQGLF